MLDSLHIENMAVIESLDVDFSTGLSVITGETGSGKSVMLGALSFLLGGKAEKELIRHGAAQATVSAVFSEIGPACAEFLSGAGLPAEGELMLQRTVGIDGKSKCRLNGRVIPLSILRELSGMLVSIHAQNDNQLLLKPSAQHRILGEVAAFGEELALYKDAFAAWKETKECLHRLNKDSAEAMRLADILRFQISEIDAAQLKVGEEEELLQKRLKLQNIEKIAKQADFTYRVLYGSEKGAAALLLERASQAMHQLATVLPEAQEAAEKLMSMRYEVEDIANTARDLADSADGDPTAALNRTEARLDSISKLRRKYGEDIAVILAFRKQAAERLCALENSEEEEAQLTALLKKQTAALQRLAEKLHEARILAAKELSESVMRELAFLDMPSVRFCICVKELADFTEDGKDETEFCIATNPGDPLHPLARIASGGELARIMLALKSVLNDRDGVATAIFDEVDTGISGKTSRKIGMKLLEIAARTQVLCVTHSAQIASLATAHYKISKTLEDTAAFSSISLLNGNERVEEVARILGGLSVTEAQRDAARDMIEEGRGL